MDDQFHPWKIVRLFLRISYEFNSFMARRPCSQRVSIFSCHFCVLASTAERDLIFSQTSTLQASSFVHYPFLALPLQLDQLYFCFLCRHNMLSDILMCPFPRLFGPQDFTKTGTLLIPESYSSIVQRIPRLSQSSSSLLRDSVHYVHHSHIDRLYVSRCSHLFQPTFPFLVSPST